MEAIDQNHRLAFLAAVDYPEPAFANAWYVQAPMGPVHELAALFNEYRLAVLPERIKQNEYVLRILQDMVRRYPDRGRLAYVDIHATQARLARLRTEAAELFC